MRTPLVPPHRSVCHLTRHIRVDLSTTTIERNAELEARVTELELELVVWKQARNNAVDMMNQEKDAHNARVATLNRQMNSLGIVKVGLVVHPSLRPDIMRIRRTHLSSAL